MLASIVITTYNRQELTDRAIKSILKCKGSEHTQIIVVDDCSTVPYTSKFLRGTDILLRNIENKGANFSRNLGLQKAVGEILYLLDSDDYYLQKDFNSDFERIKKDKKILYYCSFAYGKNVIPNLPDEVHKEDYFDFIFNKYSGIANTCSICFHRSIKQDFDPSLGRHQDWDFVHSFLRNGISLKKIDGLVYIDRSDKSSISRKKDYKKSLTWLNKIRELEGEDTYRYARYWALSKYTECMSIADFISQSYYYLKLKKINVILIIKRFIQRFL